MTSEEQPRPQGPPADPSRPLRIVLASQFALPKMCGIATIADHVARELAARGHDVTLVASSYHQPRERPAGLGFRLEIVPGWNPLEARFGVPYPLFSPLLLPRIRRILDGADVFHSHGFLSQISLAGFARARPGPVRVLTEHVGHVTYQSRLVDAVERAAIATVGRFVARRADAIVTYNDEVRAQMRALAPRARQVQIENGVDSDFYRPPSPGERAALRARLGWDDRPRVLFVGRIVDKKGAPVALEAARLGGGAFELIIVGPGRLDAAPNTRFLGRLSREAVAELYRAADLFVLPSYGEGFPLSAQEAMASGLPVVLSNQPAYVPILEGAGAAVKLVERTGSAVCAAILEFLPRSADAGAEALRFVLRRFSWSRAAEEHLALYRRLLAERSSF